MFPFLLIVQSLIALSLIGVILMQRSEGGGLGVGGSSSGFMTARGAADFLTRSTSILGGIFIVLSIVMAAIAGVTRTPTKIDTSLARPIDTAPFHAYPLRPGITFTYLGLKVDDTAAVRFGDRPSPNLFVAGEMMAGNVLGKGYTAGVGMSIGTAFGRIAGTQAAAAVLKQKEIHHANA